MVRLVKDVSRKTEGRERKEARANNMVNGKMCGCVLYFCWVGNIHGGSDHGLHEEGGKTEEGWGKENNLYLRKIGNTQ